jgi:hypothetical protein
VTSLKSTTFGVPSLLLLLLFYVPVSVRDFGPPTIADFIKLPVISRGTR